MSFAQGFSQGFGIADNYLNNQRKLGMMEERQTWDREDRDLAATKREREAMMTEYQNTFGEMSREEIDKDPRLLEFVDKWKQSGPITSRLQEGLPKGTSVKPNRILYRPDAHSVAFTVDTFKDGKPVSQDKPITQNRTSNPEDPVTEIFVEDLHDELLSTMRADPKYKDKHAATARRNAVMDELTGEAQNAETVRLQAGQSQQQQQQQVPPPQNNGAKAYADGEKSNPPLTVEKMERPQDPKAGLQAAQNLPDPGTSKLMEQRGELQRQVDGLRAARGNNYTKDVEKILDLEEQIDKISENPAVQKYDEQFAPTAPEEQAALWESVKDEIPTSFGDTTLGKLHKIWQLGRVALGYGDPKKDVAAFAAGAPAPKPEKNARVVNKAIEDGMKQAEQSLSKDKTQPLTPENTKDPSAGAKRAAQTKLDDVITQINNGAGKKLQPKSFKGLSRALSSMVSWGDITDAKALEILTGAMTAKKGGNTVKFHNAQNGQLFATINGNVVDMGNYGKDGEGSAAGTKGEQQAFIRQRQEYENIAEKLAGDKKDPKYGDYSSALSMMHDTYGFNFLQPGAEAASRRALTLREFDIGDSSTPGYIPWGRSSSEERSKRPSAAPYLALQMIGANEENLVQKRKALQLAAGERKLTDQDYMNISNLGLTVQNAAHLTGKQTEEFLMRAIPVMHNKEQVAKVLEAYVAEVRQNRGQ